MSEKIAIEEVFQAYYDCRRNKARTANALAFGLDYEAKLIELFEDISAGRYRVGRSIAFIVEKPTKREIFAGDFRDRVVHHLIFNKINRALEKDFIYDSYSCRKGKGARFGIERAKRFMRQVTGNFTTDAYVMKLDISWFFMGIDRRRMFEGLCLFLERNYDGGDLAQVIGLCETVIFHDPASDCLVKWDRANWVWLPKHKSLFFAPEWRGLPIGNLTSQVFGNFYLSQVDHFVKSTLGVRYYGRYVDDLLFFHADERFLLETENAVGDFLERELGLSLNPKKTFLGEVGKGFQFLWSYVKPHAELVGKRTKSGFSGRIAAFARRYPQDGIPPAREAMEEYRASINSYLGTISRCDSSRLRKKWVPVASGVLPSSFTHDLACKKIILDTKDHGHE